MKKGVMKILTLFLVLSLTLSGVVALFAPIEVKAASRYEIKNDNPVKGEDILNEARKWANKGAVYWSGTKPWQASVYWRTGYTYQGQTSFDCSGFVGRILNDVGYRSVSYKCSYGDCILKNKYGSNFIGISIEELVNYGENIDAAVQKAKNGDYSDLRPGDVIGWTKAGQVSRHVIFYAGLNSSGKPTMIEFTGYGYYEREITSAYQASFMYGARFVLCDCEKLNDYTDDGKCKSCGVYFNWSSTKESAKGIYYMTKDKSPSTTPYKETATSIVLKAGTSVEVVAKYKNAFDNVWYEIIYGNGQTGYIFEENIALIAESVLETRLLAKATEKTYVKSMPCSEGTNSNSKNVAVLNKGDRFDVVKIVYNSQHNFWYNVITPSGDKGWVYCGNTEVVSYDTESNSVIKGNDVPNTLPPNKGYPVNFVINSDYSYIESVTGTIYKGKNTSGTAVFTKTMDNLDGQSFSLSGTSIDNALKFGSLAEGQQYTLEIKTLLQMPYSDSSNDLKTYDYIVSKSWTFTMGSASSGGSTGGNTGSDNEDPETTESHYNIEFSYSESVKVGTIRYISQISSNQYFNWKYWPSSAFGYYTGPGNECGTSCISMALSYIGLNYTPKKILETNNGRTYFTGWTGSEYKSDISASNFSAAVDRYLNGNGKYSPVVIHLNYGQSKETNDPGHYVMIVDKVSDNVWTIVDPADSTVRNYTISGTTISYKGVTNTIDQVHQWYNSNASVCTHNAYSDIGVCENCGKAFDWNSTKKTASGSYAILDNMSPAAAPYEANSTNVVLYAGVPVKVIAQYTNAFGETWYEVSYNNGTKTGFVPRSSVQLVYDESYITSVSVTANKLTKIWSVPCSADTLSSAYVIACAMEGETLYPSRIALNVDGEYWYAVESASGERGWIPCDDVDFVASGVEDNSIIIGYDFPETIIAKGRHIVYAVKTENATIKSVTGAIYNGTATSGTAVSAKTISGINSQYYDLYNSAIDYDLTFGSLTAGKQYTLVIKTELEYKYYENSTICTGTQTVYKAWTFNAISSNSNVLTIQHNVNGGEIATNDEYYVSSSLVYSKSNSKAVETKWAYGNQDGDSLYNGATFKLYRDGYKFLGWALDPSGAGQIFDQTRLVTVEEIYPEVLNGSKTITLYAIWEKEECNHIYYNSCDTICDECGEERTILGHVYSSSCDTSCEVCGDVRYNVTHAYGDFYFVDGQYHRQDCVDCASYRVYTHTFVNGCDDYCEDCGYTRATSHEYDNACDNACNICGETRATSHKYDNACDNACNICGETRATSHEYDNACDNACNICGESRATSHEYDNACDNACNICGESRETSHEYDNACDNTCNVCGHTRIVLHSYKTVEYTEEGHWFICNDCGHTTNLGEHLFGEFVSKEPTCTEAGEKHTMCATCGYDIIEEIEPLGHTYGDFTVTKEPTCTESGEKSSICERCGDSVTEEIAPTEHTYGKYVIVEQATCEENGEKERSCSSCGDVDTEIIPAKGHNYGDWYTVGSDADGNETERRDCYNCGHYEINVIEIEPEPDPEPQTLWEIIMNFFESIIAWFAELFS